VLGGRHGPKNFSISQIDLWMTCIGLLLKPGGRLIVDISSFVYFSAEVRTVLNINIPVLRLILLQYKRRYRK
jgi:hypothetical protein